MFSAVVVDDESGARHDLVRILDRGTDVRVVGEAETVAEAAELVRRHRPDLVFLDVRLTGESGFQLLLETDDIAYAVVFVTAYDEYAIRAFEVNALDYLLKPVDAGRLADAIARASADDQDLGGDGTVESRQLRYDDWLFLQLTGGRGFLKVETISHITAEGDYTAVHTVDGERHLVLRPLSDWEERLPPPHFLRIHRGAVVNLNRVERVEPWSNYTYRVYVREYDVPLAMSRSYAKRAERILR